LGVLGGAQNGTRRAMLRELIDALKGRGGYRGTVEELTPVRGDPLAALLVIVVVLATLIDPSLWRLFHSGATGTYSLTPEAWRKIIAANDEASRRAGS
jgi:hypothetical protein